MIIAKSKLLQFKECPLSFKFQYISKIEKDTKSAYVTIKGINIHNLFNKYFDNPNIEIPLEYREIFNKFYEWNLIFSKINKNYFQPKPISINELVLKDFMAYDWVKVASKYPIQEIPIKREQHIKALDIYGIVDRINYDGSNYTLIDYKSGFYNLSELRFELNFYKYLVDSANILNKPIEFISSYGYNKGTIFFERVTERSYNLMLQKVKLFRNIKFKEILYPKKTGYHCQWCEYQMACSNINSQTTLGDFNDPF